MLMICHLLENLLLFEFLVCLRGLSILFIIIAPQLPIWNLISIVIGAEELLFHLCNAVFVFELALFKIGVKCILKLLLKVFVI